MDGSVLSGAGRVICGGFLLALKCVPEFAERVALGVQEEKLSTLLGCMYHITGITQNW